LTEGVSVIRIYLKLFKGGGQNVSDGREKHQGAVLSVLQGIIFSLDKPYGIFIFYEDAYIFFERCEFI